MAEKWVQIWGQSHSALSLFYYPSCAKTFRLVMTPAVSGKKIRLTFSNTFGKSDVKVGGVTAAKCGADGNVTGGFKDVPFGGKTSFTVKKGERTVSDEISFPLEIDEYFCVSVYVKSGDMTSGNLLDNALLLTREGNYTYTGVMGNARRKRDTVIDKAGVLLGMHLPKPIPLFDTVETLNDTGASSVVVFGDSISQQGFWTNPFEKRLKEAYPGKYTFINRSVMGNRLLRDCSPIFPARGLYGNKATERVKEDVYRFDDMTHVILFLGVNDIFEYSSINAFPWEKPDPLEVYAAIDAIREELQSRGKKVILFNVPAFGSAPDSTHEKDGLRRILNAEMEKNKDKYDGFFDVAAAAVDPEDDYQSRPDFIGPDKLHPNEFGGKFLAGLVDMEMFR